jgi:hypothetical protein
MPFYLSVSRMALLFLEERSGYPDCTIRLLLWAFNALAQPRWWEYADGRSSNKENPFVTFTYTIITTDLHVRMRGYFSFFKASLLFAGTKCAPRSTMFDKFFRVDRCTKTNWPFLHHVTCHVTCVTHMCDMRDTHVTSWHTCVTCVTHMWHHDTHVWHAWHTCEIMCPSSIMTAQYLLVLQGQDLPIWLYSW